MERLTTSSEMAKALRIHILHARKRKAQELEAGREEERLRLKKLEEERQRKQQENKMTLDDVKEQISCLQKQVKELQRHKEDLFISFKKVLNAEEEEKKKEKLRQQQLVAAHAAAMGTNVAHIGPYNRNYHPLQHGGAVSTPSGHLPYTMLPSGVGGGAGALKRHGMEESGQPGGGPVTQDYSRTFRHHPYYQNISRPSSGSITTGQPKLQQSSIVTGYVVGQADRKPPPGVQPVQPQTHRTPYAGTRQPTPQSQTSQGAAVPLMQSQYQTPPRTVAPTNSHSQSTLFGKVT